MFNKLRFSYHLAICEKLIRENKYVDWNTYELTKRYIKHRTKVQDIMKSIDEKRRRP